MTVCSPAYTVHMYVWMNDFVVGILKSSFAASQHPVVFSSAFQDHMFIPLLSSSTYLRTCTIDLMYVL